MALQITRMNKNLWWGPSGHTFCWHADADVGNYKVDSAFTGMTISYFGKSVFDDGLGAL